MRQSLQAADVKTPDEFSAWESFFAQHGLAR